MDWYEQTIVASGRAGVIWMLIAFVVTFLVTRGITRKIRRQRIEQARAHAGEVARHMVGHGVDGGDSGADSGMVRDIAIGGVHIHHQVWGLLLMLVAGMVSFAYELHSPWLEVSGVVFGIGAALVLDEFALWLHLDDVYWSAAGQKSVDAVVATVLVMTALILGSGPAGLTSDDLASGPIAIPIAIAINVVLVVITLMKGKIMMAAVGFFIPLVALFGAIRLAKVPSWWAGRFYATRPGRLERAQAREVRRRRRLQRIRDVLGGTPDPT